MNSFNLQRSTFVLFTINNTDNKSCYYHRDNKEKGFMYLDHRTVDSKANIIVDCYITKGNVHDSVPFIDRAEYI